MKKPDREQLEYVDSVWRRLRLKEAKASTCAKIRRQGAKPRKLRVFVGRTVKAVAPKIFGLRGSEMRTELIDFLDRITRFTELGAIVKISFEHTKILTSGGTLLFVATIERILAARPGTIVCEYPTDEVVEQLFQHIGILEKLGLSPRKTITAENVRHWHYLKGTNTDLSGVTNLFGVLATKLSGDTSAGLFDSISEAVTNVVQHAYVGHGEVTDSTPRWWIFAQVTSTSELQIAICDLGKGIPTSLKEKPDLADMLPALIRRMRKRVSSGMIEIAVESSRSRTKLPHRGKGLPDMLAFSKKERVGLFFIVSHDGIFHYSSHFDSEVARDFPQGISGTVIVWTIPLS